MRGQRENRDFVLDMIQSIEAIESFIQGYSFKDFSEDQKTIFAVIRAIEIIGEAANNLDDEIRAMKPDIPWHRIRGMRNRVAHEYFGVILERVWSICTEHVPPLKQDLQELFDLLNRQAEDKE